MNKNELRNTILSQIQLPCIGKNRMQVEPVPGQMQTRQLQQAIDDLSRQGGGTLVLQPGVYRTGALHLKNGVELHLASEDTLVQFVPDDPAENYPLVFSHWEASPCYNFSALLYACDAQDIAVTGKGVLDGGADADHWWNWHHQVETSWSENKPDLQLADRSALRSMNLGGVPVDRRIFGEGHYLRPNFFQSIRCQRVLLQGVTLRNSPMWQLNPVLCSSVVVDGVTLSSHGANNDGCDPESCNGVWIKNCRFDTGDDCISLKSGRDRDGREANVPCIGGTVTASAESCGAQEPLTFCWEASEDNKNWTRCGGGETIAVPDGAAYLRASAANPAGDRESSRSYRVLPAPAQGAAPRLYCRGMLNAPELERGSEPVTRLEAAQMLLPLADDQLPAPELTDTAEEAARRAAANRFFPLEKGCFAPRRTISRQEMATVAMQACGVNYRNASSTMPVCTDVDRVANNYGTNAARALYFGFMQLEADGRFDPERPVSRKEAVEILDRVADFAGL